MSDAVPSPARGTLLPLTQRRRIELLLLAAVLWVGAVLADQHHLGYVEFAFAIAGIVATLLTLIPDN